LPRPIVAPNKTADWLPVVTPGSPPRSLSRSRGVHPPCGFDSILRHQPSLPSGLPLSSGSYLSRRSRGRNTTDRTAAKTDLSLRGQPDGPPITRKASHSRHWRRDASGRANASVARSTGGPPRNSYALNREIQPGKRTGAIVRVAARGYRPTDPAPIRSTMHATNLPTVVRFALRTCPTSSSGLCWGPPP